ncbi:MAG: CopG family transcriptional regulator [Dermatophilaceae bacterium]
MHRTNIYLSDSQRVQLERRARAAGVSRAELVRQVLDRALGGDADRLDADLAALAGSFGALRDEQPDLGRADDARGAHLDALFRR